MADDNKYKPPDPDKKDAAHAVVRSGLGAIPFAGTAANELLSAMVTPSLERRRSEWMEEVGEGLRKLESEMGVVLEELPTNETFIDIALEASSIAIRNSSEEKRRALKNAVANSALPNPPEEFLQRLFLTYIDTLTDWHIKLLYLFDDPPGYLERHQVSFNASMGAPSHLVEAAFPKLGSRRQIYDLIWKDLNSRGLVSLDTLHINMTGGGVIESRTTSIAKKFIEFIQSPIEDDT